MTELPDLSLNKGRAATVLTHPARRLHHMVLNSFAETGRAPMRAEWERRADSAGIDPAAALGELTECDLVALGENGEIRAAYPFSPIPTRHRIIRDGGAEVYAMCAVDALGISAMLDVPVTVTSTEPDTDRAVSVRVDRDSARWDPETAVVFAGGTGDACGPSVDRTCGHINFFTSSDAARDWVTRNPEVSGFLLDQDQALASGVAEFGALLERAGHADGP